MLRRDTRLMPCLILDHGIYFGNVERSFPNFRSTHTEKKETKKTVEDGKELILEYIELEKQIVELQNKKVELAKKINGNSELQKMLIEVTQENTSLKSR